jgi:N-acetylmuramoyl-L-alanine amidase
VLAHSDIAPRRKIDPGEKFPWARLAERGVGHWVAPSPLGSGPGFVIGEESVAIGAVQELFAGYGYDTRRDGVFDDGFEKVVRAFQRHFRPARCDGRLDLSTLATLERLIAALPGGAVSA